MKILKRFSNGEHMARLDDGSFIIVDADMFSEVVSKDWTQLVVRIVSKRFPHIRVEYVDKEEMPGIHVSNGDAGSFFANFDKDDDVEAMFAACAKMVGMLERNAVAIDPDYFEENYLKPKLNLKN